MEPAQFRRLVENVKTDGKLTSTVLAYQLEDGSLEILSGHHRTEAAIAAGLNEVDVEVITTPLSEERKYAIQLSHNAISGQDNPSILAKMWEQLDLDSKKYSGLTDDDILNFQDIKIDGIGAASLRYQEVSLMFLPPDKAELDRALERLKGRKPPTIHAAHIEAFDVFFEAIVKTKHTLAITNSAIALLSMAELALERLAQIEQEQSNHVRHDEDGVIIEPLDPSVLAA